MEQYVVYVKDMLSPIMDFLENCGYDKHTLWGNMYNNFSSIMRFYEKLGFEYYDPPVTKKYILIMMRSAKKLLLTILRFPKT